MPTGSLGGPAPALIEIKQRARPGCLTWVRAGAWANAETVASPNTSPSGTAVKEDNITPKLLLAIAAFAAVSFAIWSGFATNVEAPVQASTPTAGLMTPF
jgi:hypothetical protein